MPPRLHAARDARVEPIAQAVAQQIHRQHHQGQANAGREDGPGRDLQIQPTRGDHATRKPRGSPQRDAKWRIASAAARRFAEWGPFQIGGSGKAADNCVPSPPAGLTSRQFMNSLKSLLATYRAQSQTEREKGSYFEELIRTYFRNEPRFADL